MSGFNRTTYWNQVRIEESCESISTAGIDDTYPFQLRYSFEVRSRVPRARECREVEAEGDRMRMDVAYEEHQSIPKRMKGVEKSGTDVPEA